MGCAALSVMQVISLLQNHPLGSLSSVPVNSAEKQPSFVLATTFFKVSYPSCSRCLTTALRHCLTLNWTFPSSCEWQKVPSLERYLQVRWQRHVFYRTATQIGYASLEINSHFGLMYSLHSSFLITWLVFLSFFISV